MASLWLPVSTFTWAMSRRSLYELCSESHRLWWSVGPLSAALAVETMGPVAAATDDAAAMMARAVRSLLTRNTAGLLLGSCSGRPVPCPPPARCSIQHATCAVSRSRQSDRGEQHRADHPKTTATDHPTQR